MEKPESGQEKTRRSGLVMIGAGPRLDAWFKSAVAGLQASHDHWHRSPIQKQRAESR